MNEKILRYMKAHNAQKKPLNKIYRNTQDDEIRKRRTNNIAVFEKKKEC
jgi:hypothetical protein